MNNLIIYIAPNFMSDITALNAKYTVRHIIIHDWKV